MWSEKKKKKSGFLYNIELLFIIRKKCRRFNKNMQQFIIDDCAGCFSFIMFDK